MVVVDDGSTDESVAVATAYGDRIRLVAKANGGQASALNAGFDACTGDIVVFLDSDDELYPEAAAELVAAWQPGAAKAHWRLDEVDADGTPVGRTNPPAAARLGSGEVRESLLRTGRYTTPVMSGNAYSRAALQEVLPIPEERFRRTADGYLTAVAALVGPVVAVERSLGAYRRHGANGWASSSIDARAIGGHVERELARYDELEKAAAVRGLDMEPDVGMRDQSGLRSRLASFRLDRAAHPAPGDRRSRLVLAGVRSMLASPEAGPRTKAAFAVWFVLVGYAPLPVARTLITWLYVPASRPSRRPR